MSLGLIDTSILTGIANAIRTKLGVQTQYKPGQMATAIGQISSGGITPTGTKQVSITQNGTTTEDVTNYASVEINASVVNADYTSALTALGVQSDLADSITALTTYANGVTGESDTNLSDAVASLGSGYGGGSVGISDGYEIKTLGADGYPTAVDHYGTKVHKQQYWNRTSTDGFWKNLETITFKNTVTSIETYAFAICTKITSIDLSAVTVMGSYAFQNCTGLVNLTLPELTALPGFAFLSCSGLKTVAAPKCTDANGQRTFGSCSALEAVQLGSVGYTVTTMNQSLFYQLTQSTLTITVYTTGDKVDNILSAIRSTNGAPNATVIFKASEATTYNGTSHAAGDTILTSTPQT